MKERITKLTMLQIRYLEELEKIPKEKKRGIITTVSDICGVDHAAVSKFFKKCIDAEYLDKNYQFTRKGEKWFQVYLENRRRVSEHLISIGVPTRNLDSSVSAIMENMDPHVLTMLTNSFHNQEDTVSSYSVQKLNQIRPLDEFVEKGNHKVAFKILKSQKNMDGFIPSMADMGFEKPGLIKNNSRGFALELRLKELKAWSRVNEEWMTGHLSSLKYLQFGIYKKANIRDGKVRISLDGCKYRFYAKDRAMGMIPIIVASNVGVKHMPESSAILLFWI